MPGGPLPPDAALGGLPSPIEETDVPLNALSRATSGSLYMLGDVGVVTSTGEMIVSWSVSLLSLDKRT